MYGAVQVRGSPRPCAFTAGKYILFGVCNEDGPHAKLARNEHVSAMLEFYTGKRGTFGPLAFVLTQFGTQHKTVKQDTRSGSCTTS